jgi:hypothetical protein
VNAGKSLVPVDDNNAGHRSYTLAAYAIFFFGLSRVKQYVTIFPVQPHSEFRECAVGAGEGLGGFCR